jgi:hypothetical protein
VVPILGCPGQAKEVSSYPWQEGNQLDVPELLPANMVQDQPKIKQKPCWVKQPSMGD